MPFGRTDLSIGGIGTTFHALLHRHGPVGPSFQGMPEEFGFHDCSKMFFDVFFPERKTGITVRALLHGYCPGGPGFQGMPEKLDFHDFSKMFF